MSTKPHSQVNNTNESTVAIVGSGIVAAAISCSLVKKGYDVTIFEKGPEYPYPHFNQFHQSIHYLYNSPAYQLPADLKSITSDGYGRNINEEYLSVVGGSATRWNAITLRMNPQDFKTRSLYGYGEDWPLTYNDLEPYYCKAEAFLGVSGTDADNPFAPFRSQPYPIQPFELSYDDMVLSEKLLRHGIILHTTPQARNRAPYEDRPMCMNFGTCDVCPTGARYSPNYHLQNAQKSGLCRIITNVSVRRIVFDKSGSARAIVYRHNESKEEREYAARVIIVAAGAIESARLLLLSANERYPNGVGNWRGHVGRHLTFHHLWHGCLHYKEPLYAGRIGPVTGQSHQFIDPPERGNHGGIKIEFSSHFIGNFPAWRSSMWGKDIVEVLKPLPYRRGIIFHAESSASTEKYVALSDKRDRFGDPLAHIRYKSNNFDYETYNFACELFNHFAEATDGEKVELENAGQFSSGAHHMGTCRMGQNEHDSVVNEFGRVHGNPNLFVVGTSNFVGSSGAVNPTLTSVALAMRTADYLIHRVL